MTSPVVPTVAIVAGILLHDPPDVASASVVTEPAHTVAVPVMGDGAGLTVTDDVTNEVQPALLVTV